MSKSATGEIVAVSTEAAPLYNASFFSEEFRSSRKQLIRILLLPLVYTALLMWGCLSLYFGSLVSSTNFTKLSIYAIDLDGGFLGQQVMAGIRKQVGQPGALDWHFEDPIASSTIPQQLILEERAWAVVQVSANASSNLDAALNGSDTFPYDPLSAVTLFFASARNQITTGSAVLPAVMAAMNPILGQASVEHTAQFLAASSNNPSALANAQKCPQCLAQPFAMAQQDLIHFDVPVALGTTMVGLVFLLTFAFSVFQILRASGVLVGSRLAIRPTLYFRTIVALLSYLFIALMFTLVNIAFGVPMSRSYLGRGGFVVYWLLNTCTMGAVGLPMESLFTLVGLQWSSYFLTFWIMVNTSGAFQSFDLMPGFYKYGYGIPFYNSIQGARTIIFGTKSHLGQNFGVLIAWMVVGMVGMWMNTIWVMRRDKRRGIHFS